ncbi:Regulatory protein RecX [bioreactor metagenome]|uniref:Regulatory protein RecX n=1 Tax=bioreactor metagenome TaxID=1076179 RepID=A0A644T103_9ZZZZ|nr:RecX family transcriptional regulator [Negativicutes bacterium]
MRQPNKYTAQQAAVRMLNIRAYSENEIRQKLSLRGFESTAVEDAINYLHDHSYLNDRAICYSLFESYCKSNKYSFKFIVMKLKQRGISETIIRETTKGYDFSFEAEAACNITKKHFKQIEATDKIRINRYLAAKGFTISTITKIINNLERNAPG